MSSRTCCREDINTTDLSKLDMRRGRFAREGKTERARRCVARFYWLFLRARARADDPYVSLSKDRFFGRNRKLKATEFALTWPKTVVSL